MELDAACSRCAPSPRNDDAMAAQPTAVLQPLKVDPRRNSAVLMEVRRAVERSVGAEESNAMQGDPTRSLGSTVVRWLSAAASLRAVTVV